MVEDNDTFIDTSTGEMYAVNSTDEENNEVECVRTERITLSLEEFEERLDSDEFISPTKLQERLEDIMDGFSRSLAIVTLLKLAKGEDVNTMDVPDELAEFIESSSNDGENSDADKSDLGFA